MPAAHRLSRVDALDLEPIVYKLTHPEPGETALSLGVPYPAATIVASRQIDHAWHMLILDAARYRADCDHVHGRFLDDFPYAGLCEEADRQAWREDFVRTQLLFREDFGIDIGTQPAASACIKHGEGAQCIVGCVKPPGTCPRPTAERVRPELTGPAAGAAGDRMGRTRTEPG